MEYMAVIIGRENGKARGFVSPVDETTLNYFEQKEGVDLEYKGPDYNRAVEAVNEAVGLTKKLDTKE